MSFTGSKKLSKPYQGACALVGMKQSCRIAKAVLLLLVLDYCLQAHSLTCLKETIYANVFVEWKCFPSKEDAECYSLRNSHIKNSNHTLVLNSSALNECIPDCRTYINELNVNEKYYIDVTAVKNKDILETRSFSIYTFEESIIKTETTTTRAFFRWNPPDSEVQVSLMLNTFTWRVPKTQSTYQVTDLKPGTPHNFSVEFKTQIPNMNVVVTQTLNILLETALCPLGWVQFDRSCYKTWKNARKWSDAQKSCELSMAGAHLVDIETEEEFHFISSYLSTLNYMVMLWTGLNDKQREGELRQSDGSVSNLKNDVPEPLHILPPNETDCFALKMNATGPNYYYTGFFCYIPLPYLCQYTFSTAPADFEFEVEDVKEKEAGFKWSNLEHWLKPEEKTSLLIQYEEELSTEQWHTRSLPLNGTRLTISGLSPGHVYLFSFKVMHHGGASRTLGPIRKVQTRPNPPQNITVKKVTSKEIPLYWTAPDNSHNASFDHYLITCVDVATSMKKSLVVENYKTSAVITNLKSFHLFSINIQTVSAFGSLSCVDLPLFITTAVSPPSRVYINPEDVGVENVTVHWEVEQEEDIDEYYVLVRSVTVGGDTKSYWVNSSNSFKLSMLSPGMTYEIGVAAVKSGNMSEMKTVLQTLNPERVQIVVPYEQNTHSVVLYIQMPHAGIFDGVNITYKGGSQRKILPDSNDKITIEHLTPGTNYDFSVYTTSGNMASAVYHVPDVKTCLAPPTNVHEGKVSETSIDVQWNRAEGSFQQYEVICINCAATFTVKKIKDERALFTNLIPGQMYNFSIRTEKDNFKDSMQVLQQIQTAPSQVELLEFNKSSNTISVSWSAGQHIFDGFVLSITNGSFNKEKKFSFLDPRYHQFRDLTPGSSYNIDIVTTSGTKRSLPNVIHVTTYPEPPVDIHFIEQDENSIYVTWSHPRGYVDGYKLSYGLSGSKETLYKTTLRNNTIRIKDLAPGIEYLFKLQSLKGSETSAAVTKIVTARPSGICSLSLTYINTSAAGIMWKSSPGKFDYYKISISNISFIYELNISKESLNYTASGLFPGNLYNITVQRVRLGITGMAAFVTVVTEPDRPQDVRVVSTSSDRFSLRWRAPSGHVDRYQVDVTPNEGTITVTNLSAEESQADVSSVTPGQPYTVTVSAVSSSAYSSPVSRIVTTNETTPGAPLNLEGERVGSTGILLSWTVPPEPNGKILSYAIKYKEVCPWPDSSFTQVLTYSDIPEFLLNTLTPGSTYNIKVAAENSAGIGVFTSSLYFKTAESPPGLVTNLTAFSYNHSTVKVTWYLPIRTNGLITKFSIKVKHARNGQTVRSWEVNAEDIMKGTLPHCNDAAEILSRSTPSPSVSSLLTSASSPPMTISAIPPASSWAKPISVVVDQLKSYTAYVFEVSAFTSDGEGQIASYMVRMPESAPEDPPQNLTAWNITSKSFSVSWDAPTIVTGRFSYVIELHGLLGFIFENTTSDMRFSYFGLTPYTTYTVVVRAKSAGALGPHANTTVLTPAEAPSEVIGLKATVIDSTSVKLSWKSPQHPNGIITQYKILVLMKGLHVQSIFLRGKVKDLNYTTLDSDGMVIQNVTLGNSDLYEGTTDLISSTLSPVSPLTSSFPSSAKIPFLADRPSTTSHTSESSTASFVTQAPLTSSLPQTSLHAGTLRSWSSNAAYSLPYTATDNTKPTEGNGATTKAPLSFTSTSGSLPTETAAPPEEILRFTSFDSNPTHPRVSARAAVFADVPGVKVTNIEVPDISADQISYVVTNLIPFTEYTFSVSAFTAVGEGPPTKISEKTREQVPSSVQNVYYQNISSTSILLSWDPPLNPNGKIIHYTVYGMDLLTKEAFHKIANQTQIILSGLKKYTEYKLRVAASTIVGESSLSEEDDIFVITPEDEPESPPTNLTVIELTASTAIIKWSPPEKPNGIIKYYQVLYENSTSWLTVNSSTTSVKLKNLKPFSFYNVSVRAYTKYGYGNQTSTTLTLLTSEDAPGSPPFNLTYGSISSTKITVSWLSPLHANGIILSYTVQYWNASHSLNISTNSTKVIISNLKKNAWYWITVVANTKFGSGNQTSDVLNVTTLEDVPDGPVSNLNAQNISSTTISVSWLPPDSPNGRVFYMVSLREAQTNTPTLKLTTNKTVILFENLQKYTDYILEVTAATVAGFSENTTTIKYLRTDEDIPGSPPLISSATNLSSSSIRVSWKPPNQPNGVILNYSIALAGPTGPSISFTSNTSLILSNLTPFTPYNVSISAINKRGIGPSTSFLLYTDEAEPSSPPQNLMISNYTANSMWLKWNPSPEPNGIVQLYNFKIFENKSQTLSYQNTSGRVTETQLSGFKPSGFYEISVSAFTKVGNGNLFSNSVTFITNESVSDVVQNLHCIGTNWQSVFIEWESPIDPNGVITHYIIEFGHNVQELKPFELKRTIRGLHANTTYVFLVMAVNSAGKGKNHSCIARTLEESVPSAPRNLNVSDIQSTSVTLSWSQPDTIPGYLQEYQIVVQRLSTWCNDWITAECVENEAMHYTNGTDEVLEVTVYSLMKFRRYRFRVAARTNAGYGNASEWITTETLPGYPDAAPENVTVVVSSNNMKISWEDPEVVTGPTFYLIDITSVDSDVFNYTLVRRNEETKNVVVSNLTAFTRYSVIVTAFTGDVKDARVHGKASKPIYVRTLEDEPKDPPKNVTFQTIPNNVTRVYVTFSPPVEPNGNISAYWAKVFRGGTLDFEIKSLPITENENHTLTAVIEGLKGGHTYSIRISAVNGAGPGPSAEVKITMDTLAPPVPSRKPVPALDRGGSVIATSRTITIRMPVCFFTDHHGPIGKVQVIVAEASVSDDNNVTTWKEAFFNKPKPYFTSEGFGNPLCSENTRLFTGVDTYVIGAEDNCLSMEKDNKLCNGPLKPKKQYVFKFRATNSKGQFTDSSYSDPVVTKADRLLNRDDQIILGVVLSIVLAAFLVLVIYAFARIRQKQKEGGTYSPRDAEIIDTKFKLDQLIAVADLKMKEEKLNRLLSYRKSLKPVNKKSFLQHVEDLCANDNVKFQEEFSELPKLLLDLATSDADLPWNRSKNRFTNIKPYNNNRVKLMSELGVPGSDYINASYVSGYLCPNEFIATQGPLPGTVADFWRMIWETRTRTIAMLTQCFEKGRIRCHQYWPEDNKPVTVFGDIVITKLAEDVHPDWTIRVLKVERHGDYMVVNHFNFTSWPEHGVPESSTALIQFVKFIRANRAHDNTTIVVHCSAGVGRTGVFIALDHLIQHVRDHDFVDIYGLVAELRSERMCMVQNLAQYMFLHQCTLDLLSSKGNSQSVWFVNYSALEKMDSLDAMEGDVELEWEETSM
ncbi:phosphatidylinositol phosphatase PTPRQ isoform X2 [Lepisosteus oculatus]|uniref:phosphatidylinositol phosphatase PTPRQ isoform X2 n=1 Tax=Lepisosteus oculatus TaxID=7918 RepID=UPI0037246BBC